MKKLSTETLNFIIAFCAILISAASFYATYLQAQSANHQVKAMTYPLLQLEHGNFDLAAKSENLYILLRNSGVGPAQIKSLRFHHNDNAYSSIHEFLNACCQPEYEEFGSKVKAKEIPIEASLITADASGVILSPGDELSLMTLMRSPANEALWSRINAERFNAFSIDACYCSLLDRCYQLSAAQKVAEVPSCESN